jgi:hypothetical protein
VSRLGKLSLTAAALVLGGFAYERFWRPPTEAERCRLRDERVLLEDALARRVDPIVAGIPDTAVVLGMPSSFAGRLTREIVSTLVPELHLTLRNVKAHHEGEVRAKVLVGRSQLGTYAVRVHLDEVRLLLRPGRPKLRFGGERVRVAIPVSLVQGTGRGRLRFEWDGHGLAGAVCGDVLVADRIAGSVRPAERTVEGTFRLSAEGSAVMAHPEFEDLRLTVHVDPSRETWQIVERAIAGQGALCRRAIGIVELREKVEAVVDRGFKVTLPGHILHDVRLPVSVQGTLDEGSGARFEARPTQLALLPGWLWYGADVQLTGRAAPAASPGP